MIRPDFWNHISLECMTKEEWEALCDGCGRCCLHKLREEETNIILFTNVACRLLNTKTAQCKDYLHRQKKIIDCITLTPDMIKEIDWLPPTCAYRLLHEGRPLPSWHPLLTKDRQLIKEARISVGVWDIVSEKDAGPLEDHIVNWPGQNPAK